MLALGAWLVINQQATAGVMLAATILSIRALAPIELAIANWRGFIAARASFERLRENFTTMPAKTDPTTLPAPSRELRVTSVSLTAPRSENLVLHDVSFALSAGSAVAIVGPSGSGKTTLARALVGVGTPRARRDPDRRRGARAMESDRARPLDRLSAAGRGAVPRHGRTEHLAFCVAPPSGAADARGERRPACMN